MDNFKYLEENYSNCASWTIWSEKNNTQTSNVGDLNIFKEGFQNQLNYNYVFVALNCSNIKEQYRLRGKWWAFHSPDPLHKDYKMRHAFKETNFWGCYITDLVKNYEQVNSAKVEISQKDIDLLKKELQYFKKPLTIIALGRKVYNCLNKSLDKNNFNVKYLTHYSHYISAENYKIKASKLLKELEHEGK